MLGTFRFLLSWFVMLSHLPYSPFPIRFNLGVSSVVLFYFISGYLMYISYSKIVKQNFKNNILAFYKKRVIRLFPLYSIILFLTIIFIYFFGKSTTLPLLNQDLSFEKILINSLLIFNNYVFEPFTIKELLPHPLIPPTWSLSTEIHFYIFVPFLYYVLKNKKFIFYSILLASLMFELLSFSYSLPNFNSNNFGYRYIFGVLWIFMFGFLYSSDLDKKFFKIIYSVILVYTMFLGFYFSQHIYVKEILVGLFITPFIKDIINKKFKYDNLFGKLSYPIFLSHFLIFYISEKILGEYIKHKVLYFSIVFLLILFTSYFLSKIEDYLKKKLYKTFLFR